MTKKKQTGNSASSQSFEIDPYHTVITVTGIGGAGNNTINYLMEKNDEIIQAIAVNTDAQDLLETHSDKRILIGRDITGGLGAGGDPEIGERAAEESKELLVSALEGTDMLFVVCGLGGGTGTGSVPVIGKLAKKLGILSIAIVTMPFSEEGIIRWENAQIGLEKLRKNIDSLIVLKNDRLIELFPDVPVSEAFKAGNEILINAVVGLSNLVLQKGIINLDFADVSMVMRDGVNTLIGVGESNSENRAEEATQRAISHPMMEKDIRGVQSVLIHVTGGPVLSLKEVHQVVKNVSEKLDPNARIIWGATIDEHHGETLRVMLIMSGIYEEEPTHEKAEEHYGSDESGTFDRSKTTEKGSDYNGRTIFDIKESIISSGAEVTTEPKQMKPVTQTTQLFYKIFEEEATGDLRQFDRAIHFLRENPENRRAQTDARKASKLLLASAQMFGFDEIGQLLSSIEEIFACVLSGDIKLTSQILDSITLAMELIMDLVENQSDGRGETGYIVDRLKELKEEQIESLNSNESIRSY